MVGGSPRTTGSPGGTALTKELSPFSPAISWAGNTRGFSEAAVPKQSVEQRRSPVNGPSLAEDLEAVFCTQMDGTLVASWTTEDVRTDVASAMVATLTHSVEGILRSLGLPASGPIDVTVAGYSIHVERPRPSRLMMAIARHRLTRKELARSLAACRAALEDPPLSLTRNGGVYRVRARSKPAVGPGGLRGEPRRRGDGEALPSELGASGSRFDPIVTPAGPSRPVAGSLRDSSVPVRPPDTLVAHPCRRAILDHLSGEPGDHLRSIARDLALPLGSVRFHLAMLEKCGLVRAESRGGKARYFRVGPGSSAQSNDLFSRYWSYHDVRSRVAAAAARLASRDVSRVAASVGISRQLALYHLRRLPDGARPAALATGPTSATESTPPSERIGPRPDRDPRDSGSTV